MGLRNRSKRLVALPKVTICASLCNLCVLCVSVVDEFRAKTHHRDTENTEVAQRILRTRTFEAKQSTLSKEGSRATTFSGAQGLFSGHLGSIDHAGPRSFESYSLLSNPAQFPFWCRELSEWAFGLAGLSFYYLAFRFSFYSSARCRSHLAQFHRVGRDVFA